MTKKEARKYFLTKRLQLSQEEVSNLSSLIFTQWKASGLVDFNTYHIFLSIKNKNEINTHLFIEALWGDSKRVYCSKVEGDHLIHFKLTPDVQLKESIWGIPEPVEEEVVGIKTLDCILIPLLAYDFKGNRVGYGKGYYDRFLKQYPQAKKIGLSFFEPIQKVETDPSDIPLDYIITPYFFSGFPIEEK